MWTYIKYLRNASRNTFRRVIIEWKYYSLPLNTTQFPLWKTAGYVSGKVIFARWVFIPLCIAEYLGKNQKAKVDDVVYVLWGIEQSGNSHPPQLQKLMGSDWVCLFGWRWFCMYSWERIQWWLVYLGELVACFY